MAEAPAPEPGEAPAEPAATPAESDPPKAPKPPREKGVGLAIVGTVIIVLGLAALATYAYLQTK
jgi:hypothetical protein